MTDAAEESPAVVEALAAAVATTATKSEAWRFVGWGPDDRPAATDQVSDLSRPAHRAFVIYRESGLWPRQVRFAAVEPVEYILTGAALDFVDTAQHKAQDHVQYVILDSRGERREISLGELVLLEGIVAGREPWQSLSEASATDYARSAVAMYTVFVPHPEGPADRGLALLFRPTIPGEGNSATFRAFVRHSLGRLLVLDESQPRAARKGYLDAAADFAALPPKGGPTAWFHWLRSLGAVEFEDKWLRRVDRRVGRLQAGTLRVARALGMVDVSEEALEELANPRPTYDLDRLDVAGLVKLAEAMYWAARRALA